MNTLHSCLTYYLLAINAVAFIMYGIDKYKAKKAKWRISEATLLLLVIKNLIMKYKKYLIYGWE